MDDKPEAEFIASHKAESWEEAKVQINEIFAQAMKNADVGTVSFSDSPSFRVRPIVSAIETGYYRIPAWNAVTRIHMTVQVLDAAGQVADELFLLDSVSFDAVGGKVTVKGRLGLVAQSLGDMLGDYLEERVEK